MTFLFQLGVLVLDQSMCTQGLVCFCQAPCVPLCVPAILPQCPVLPTNLLRWMRHCGPAPGHSAWLPGFSFSMLCSSQRAPSASPPLRTLGRAHLPLLTHAWLWALLRGACLRACLASYVIFLLNFCASSQSLLPADHPTSLLISHLPFASNFCFFETIVSFIYLFLAVLGLCCMRAVLRCSVVSDSL